MDILDVIYSVLKSSYNNYDELFKDNDIKEYIKDSILFIEKYKEFLSLIKSSSLNDIEKLNALSSELVKIQNKFKYFCKLESEEYKGELSTISFIILKNNNIFENYNNLLDINKSLSNNLFAPINGYNLIIKDLYDKVKNNINYNIYNYRDMNVNEYKILKALLCILKMYVNVYEKNGIKGLNKIKNVNNAIYKMKDMYRLNIYSRKVDLYDLLYGYKNLFEIKDLNSIDSMCNYLYDIADNDGMFDGLNEFEIAEILYKCYIHEKLNLIKSDDNEYDFKDLKVIVRAIKNGISNGKESSRTIDEFISGKLKLNISEKQNGGHYGTI